VHAILRALSGKHEKGKENRVEGNDKGQRERPAMGSHESGAAQISENAADEGIKFRVQGSVRRLKPARCCE